MSDEQAKMMCPTCGSIHYEGKLRECPHCGASKCSTCDMGDNCECPALAVAMTRRMTMSEATLALLNLHPFYHDEPVPREHVCCSGEHTWASADDAARCCHPDWRRERRDIHARSTLGVMYREVWVRRDRDGS